MSETLLVRGPSATSFRIGVAPGLGLLPNVIIDQHFAQRGRIDRLIGYCLAESSCAWNRNR